MDEQHRAALAACLESPVDVTSLGRMRGLVAAREPVHPTGVELVDVNASASGGRSLVVRVYRPAEAEEELPLLLYLHGGGYVLGSPAVADARCADHVRRNRCVVVSVDYRLAPEHPFPAGLVDARAALDWCRSSGLLHPGVPWGLAGFSAGGGLAAALVRWLRDDDASLPEFVVLESPMLDPSAGQGSVAERRATRVWSSESNDFAWSAYLAGGEGNELAAYASSSGGTELEGLPPVLLLTTDSDLFHDETVSFAFGLDEAGVDVDLLVMPGGFHGSAGMLPDAPLSRRWTDAIVGYVSAGFARSTADAASHQTPGVA